MIKKEEIVIGTKEELVDYFHQLSGSTEKYMTESKSSLLTTKEGIQRQIEEFQVNSKLTNNIGKLFFMTTTVETENGIPETTLNLVSSYFIVKG
jgi:hypothetical protein